MRYGFTYFTTNPGKLAIENLKVKHLQNISTAEESVIADAFIKADRVMLSKIIKAVQKNESDFKRNSNTAHSIENIMLKPVSDICNLACTYCYEGIGNIRYSNSVMTEETLEKAIMEAFQLGTNHLNFLWHGGEPTLAGINFFEKAIRLQDSLNFSKIPVDNT